MTTETSQLVVQEQIRYNLYFSRVGSMQTVMGNGKVIVFVAGRYHTKNAAEIEFLDQLCETNPDSVYKKSDQLTASEDDMDPMKALEAQFRAKFLAEMAAQLDPTSDRGSYEPGKLNAANTTSIAPVSAGAGQIGGAALAALQAKIAHVNLTTPVVTQATQA